MANGEGSSESGGESKGRFNLYFGVFKELVVAFFRSELGKRNLRILFQSKDKKLLILTSSWSFGFATKGLGRCSLPS
jgi:hypothetical protein